MKLLFIYVVHWWLWVSVCECVCQQPASKWMLSFGQLSVCVCKCVECGLRNRRVENGSQIHFRVHRSLRNRRRKQKKRMGSVVRWSTLRMFECKFLRPSFIEKSFRSISRISMRVRLVVLRWETRIIIITVSPGVVVVFFLLSRSGVSVSNWKRSSWSAWNIQWHSVVAFTTAWTNFRWWWIDGVRT